MIGSDTAADPRPLLHIPAYVPASAPPDQQPGLRVYLVELLLASLHGLHTHAQDAELLVTTNDEQIFDLVARHRARAGQRLELRRVTPQETLAAFRVGPERLGTDVCARYLFPKLFPMVQRLAPWIVHLDLDTLVRGRIDAGALGAAELGFVDANRLGGWPRWAPKPAAVAFFGLESCAPAEWSWLNTGVFSVRGAGFDVLERGLEHYLANLDRAIADGLANEGEECLMNALALRERAAVAVVQDPNDNVLAYDLSRHPTWHRDARVVHFHSLKPHIYWCEGGQVAFSCSPAQAERATLEFYLAALLWCRELHAAAVPLGLALPMMSRMPAAFVEAELARVPRMMESRAQQPRGRAGGPSEPPPA